MTSEHSAGPDERATGRFRRVPVLAAAVALGVMLAGGGVAYTAAQTGGDSGREASRSDDAAPRDETPPPVLELTPYGTGAVSQWPGVPLRATGELPSDGPESAPVYGATAAVTQEAVARLAEEFGLAGQPRREGDAWLVGAAGDGQGPLLRVAVTAPGAWSYTTYAAGSGGDLDCVAPEVQGEGCPSSDGCSETKCVDGLPPVSERAAKEAAAGVLRAQGYREAAYDASRTYGSLRTVEADPVVGGLPTAGWRTRLQVDHDGKVALASGQLTTPAERETYPVVGAEETLRALNKARAQWAKLGSAPDCATAVPYGSDGSVGSGGGSDAVLGKDGEVGEVQPCPPVKQAPLAVTGAEFGLSAARTAAGQQLLVPSWLYEVSGHGVIAYPAVAPRYVREAPAATPTPSPTPTPGAPGTGRPSDPSKVRHAVAVTSYAASGNEVKVTFWGGVCTAYSASAEESGTSVTVRVVGEDEPGKVCIELAKEFTLTVKLERPLGERAVIDGATGKRVPRG
ncbi:hypothetical protein AB0M28_40195 [Streptomyces sp. NPDC051940]|uniref:hypothetical protein n=1 Tax=Streptomyces sp. NPDC051940 TaxID=3155675 RepID=UPI0034190944